jgi:LPS-assembly protein
LPRSERLKKHRAHSERGFLSFGEALAKEQVGTNPVTEPKRSQNSKRPFSFPFFPNGHGIFEHAPMTRLPIIAAVAVFSFAVSFSLHAEELSSPIEIRSLKPGQTSVTYDLKHHTAAGTNGIFINYNGSILTADSVSVDQSTGWGIADGNVRIQQGDEIWVGDHMRYNFRTREMISENFRTGKSPVYMEGMGLHGNIASNRTERSTYAATNGFITTDDVHSPEFKIRASRMIIIPNQKIEAWNAVLYVDGVPVFYLPYYSRNLGPHANNFDFVPGYRSSYGPFVLGSYTWYLNNELNGKFHLDYRQRRGPGVGPDFNYNLGRWGEGTLKYYYTHDDDPSTNIINAPVFENRQRVYFTYLAEPYTNLEVRSLVRYQSDAGVLRDFFEGEYRQDPQPDTIIEADKLTSNFSLDVLTRPRINDFYETVERLPDVRLTGFRQQIWGLPFYYESESSVGYFRRLFAETNGAPANTNYSAGRADTYHQIVLPETLFGWLNVTPRAGGRFTYYSEASGPGATTDEQTRGIFNTGAEVSFKASQLWADAHSSVLQVDGLRHIIEPSINYVYVPRPNVTPNQLPQFDYQLPSLRMLPIEFPEYNSIDSIDSQNVMRFGLRNQFQTKRFGQVEELLDWQVYADWRIKPQNGQRTYGDLYSDATLRPRNWITLDSQTRLDLNTGDWRMLLHTLTLSPNDVWSWTLGHFYLRDDFSSSPTALGQGDNVFTSALFFRINENWSTRFVHHFDVRSGRLQEQYYSLYRDMRSWTCALTAGLRDNPGGPQDFSLVFTFSFKAVPKFPVGGDSVRPYSLLGLQE